jgi:hypothetical protein
MDNICNTYKSELQRLTSDAQNNIRNQYLICLQDENVSGVAGGSHWILLAAWNAVGIKLISTKDAMELAECLF